MEKKFFFLLQPMVVKLFHILLGSEFFTAILLCLATLHVALRVEDPSEVIDIAFASTFLMQSALTILYLSSHFLHLQAFEL